MPSGLKVGQARCLFSEMQCISHHESPRSAHTQKSKCIQVNPLSGVYKGVDTSGRHLVQRLKGRDRGARVGEGGLTGGRGTGLGRPRRAVAVGHPHEPAFLPFSPACEASLGMTSAPTAAKERLSQGASGFLHASSQPAKGSLLEFYSRIQTQLGSSLGTCEKLAQSLSATDQQNLAPGLY